MFLSISSKYSKIKVNGTKIYFGKEQGILTERSKEQTLGNQNNVIYKSNDEKKVA